MILRILEYRVKVSEYCIIDYCNTSLRKHKYQYFTYLKICIYIYIYIFVEGGINSTVTSHKKVFQRKTSACRDGTLKNQPNKMGTTPQHIHTIPTSCAIFLFFFGIVFRNGKREERWGKKKMHTL